MKSKEDIQLKTRPVALVTGGTRGIGKAIVEQLLQDGFFVIINYREESENTKKIRLTLQKKSPHLYFFKADIADEKTIKTIFRKIKKEIKTLDVIVNNAGIINEKDETLENISLPKLHKIINTNIFGSIHILKEALSLIKKSSRGRIIFINSAISFVGSKNQFGYALSKTAAVGIVRALTLELAPWNICVNAIVPGSIRTRMIRQTGIALQEKLKKIPLGRLGEPKEVANLVSFLCSTKSNYITGQHIHINGGRFFS